MPPSDPPPLQAAPPGEPKNTVGAERRLHTRRAIRTVARISTRNGVIDVRTIDASIGGLAIAADINPPVGTEFQIALQLPGKRGALEPFTASVRVMYSAYAADQGRFKIGLQFGKLDPASEKVLRAFLA